MRLLVDIPKAGYGNTNDGSNTSRRFFNNEEDAASITSVDLSLIKKFKVILEVLSSGYVMIPFQNSQWIVCRFVSMATYVAHST